MSFPTGLIILLFILWIYGLLFYVFPDKRHRRSPRWDRSGRGLHSAGHWLRSGPPFRQRPLLNKGEGRLLTLLDRIVPEILGTDARMCPQVSYGEFLICSKLSKFARMNSRRGAFVVELQGSGHFGSTAKSAWKARYADRTKRSALQEADIPLLEVGSTASEASVTAQIQGLIASRAYKHMPHWLAGPTDFSSMKCSASPVGPRNCRPATTYKEGYNHV